MKSTVLLTAVFLLSTSAIAQVSTTTLTGLITDPSGAAIPNVELKLTCDETGVVNRSATDAKGEYTVPLLPPGHYRVEASASGFQPQLRSGLVLEIGRVFRVDMQFQLGQTNQTVEVTGSAPLLESENSSISQLIENKSVQDMPLMGRRAGDLVALMGNAILLKSDVFIPRLSIGGGRADQQMWLLDGVTAQNIALESPQTNFNPPVESLQEFRVLQNNYSAEYGNTNAGVISFSTRSGTNEFHGSAYEFFRNDKSNARDFFAAQKAPLRWNLFGFAAGGPVIRNRTFFFVSTEWQLQRLGATSIYNVPTPEQRAGDFSKTVTAAGALIRIYDPGTTRPDPANPARTIRDPFPNNVIPAGQLDPVAVNLVKLYPQPNRPASNLAGANNFGKNSVNKLNSTTLTTKIDHVLRQKDRLSGRFVIYNMPTQVTPTFDEPAADPNVSYGYPREYSLLINEIHTFSSAVLNDFRYDWGPRTYRSLTLGLGGNWPEKLGLKGVSNRAFPYVNVSGFSAMGRSNQERLQAPIHETHIVNHLSWFRRSHAFKFGGETRLALNVDRLNSLISGSLTFGQQSTMLPGSTDTGSALGSMLLGLPLSAQVRYTDALDRRMKYFAWFVHDDWKLTRRLTINLGVRWEAHTARLDENNRQNGFDAIAINPVSNTPGVITFAGLLGTPRNVYNADYNNIAPRVGLAWRPFGGEKTVIRAAYGIFYGPSMPGSNNTSVGFQTAGDFSSPDNGITAPFVLRNGFPSTERQPLTAGFGAVVPGQPVRTAPDYLEVNRRFGYSQQWNFTAQRELRKQLLLEASYMANVGHGLLGVNSSINQVLPQLMGPGNAQVKRPFPQFGDVITANPMWANSSYHSLNIKVERRFAHGVNLLANYTYSKFIDDLSTGNDLGNVSGGIQNIYDRRAEKALSGNDIRNRFNLSSVMEIPVGRGRRWLTRGPLATAFGGWNLGPIITLRQGSPFGLVTQTNTTNAFTPGSQRVTLIRNPALPPSERTLNRWFDTGAVAAPAPYTFGNAGRSILTGPGLTNVDASLLKNHRFRDRWNAQVRVEAFNVFNHANFMVPGRALGNPNFGIVSSTRAARVLQLGLRLEW